MPGVRKSSNPIRRAQHKEATRQMRHLPTPAERVLWSRLRNRQIANTKFRRQHSIDRFMVDFYCAEAQLVIEVDGPIHDTPSNDAERQQMLATLGLWVLRFRNDEVLHSIDSVIERIEKAVRLRTPPDPLGETGR